MTTLVLLWMLGLVHSGFAGFREAAGRNLRIRKASFFARAVLRGIGIGQAASTIIFGVVLSLYLGSDDRPELLAMLSRAGESALAVYLGYTCLVLLAFVPYTFRSVEIRMLTIVAVFGPLTLMLPLVMIVGAAAAILTVPRAEVAILFSTSIAAVSVVEPALAWFGFSKRDSERARQP